MLTDPLDRVIQLTEERFGVVFGRGHKGCTLLLLPTGEVLHALGDFDLFERCHTAAQTMTFITPSPEHKAALNEIAWFCQS